ncbi:MAG: rhomboid family intramembrane serine protease [Chthoniobacterales bacterium]|nr:rhomboid family intramembrane serine protease [Chthoniobacterales bacterium]
MRLSGRRASSHAPPWASRQRVILFALLGANCAAFVAQLLLQNYEPATIPTYLGLSYRGIDQAFAWQFFSALFLPGNIFQFAANILALYFIGRDVEAILGQKHFLYLYLLGAAGGELGHLLLMPSTTVLLAASGGVAAVVVAFGTILPELEMAGAIFFLLPVKLKAKHFAYLVFALGGLLLAIDRRGVVSHSAYMGGCCAGWLYAHLLGFGRVSFVQRFLRERKMEHERRRQMSVAEFMNEEIDPLLEKISRCGLTSLTRSERRKLAEMRVKMAAPPQ